MSARHKLSARARGLSQGLYLFTKLTRKHCTLLFWKELNQLRQAQDFFEIRRLANDTKLS